MADLEPALRRARRRFGIATEYWDWQGRHVAVPAETIIAVLAALGGRRRYRGGRGRRCAEHADGPWPRKLPPLPAIREQPDRGGLGARTDGDPVASGSSSRPATTATAAAAGELDPPREMDGRWVGEARFEIPGDLPLGYHTLRARSAATRRAMPGLITPAWLGFPERMGGSAPGGGRRSCTACGRGSPGGSGTWVDLEDLAAWSAAEHGADFVLVNPLHAAEPGAAAGAVALPADHAGASPTRSTCGRSGSPSTRWPRRRQRAEVDQLPGRPRRPS